MFIMCLYLFNIILFLCSGALLCASQQPVEVDTGIAVHWAFANHNESNPRLFSRNSVNKRGPVRTVVKRVLRDTTAYFIGKGSSGRTFMIPNGFPVGALNIPSVLKFVRIRKQSDRDMMSLELAFLDAVGQLLGYGIMTKDDREHYCIVMKYMGMTEEKALKRGLQKDQIPKLTEGLVASYAQEFKVEYLDNIAPNTVFEEVPSHAEGWKAHLVDWGYARFTSQPLIPRIQEFSAECELPGDLCVYHAVTNNLGKEIERAKTSRFSMYNRLEGMFGGSLAVVRKMEVRNLRDCHSMDYEVMGQFAIGDFITWAYFDCAPPDSKKYCTDYYLVTQYRGDPVKPNQFTEDEELRLRQEAKERYEKDHKLIHPGNRREDFVYQDVNGKQMAFIIDNWAFALPVGRVNASNLYHEIFTM